MHFVCSDNKKYKTIFVCYFLILKIVAYTSPAAGWNIRPKPESRIYQKLEGQNIDHKAEIDIIKAIVGKWLDLSNRV